MLHRDTVRGVISYSLVSYLAASSAAVIQGMKQADPEAIWLMQGTKRERERQTQRANRDETDRRERVENLIYLLFV